MWRNGSAAVSKTAGGSSILSTGANFIFKEFDMKYFRVGVPFLVVLLAVINGAVAYSVDNMPAVHANITAFFGWVAISYSEYLTFRRENRSV